MTYFVYVLASTGSRDFDGSFGLLYGTATVVLELASWLVAALVLGAAFATLPGRNGVLKGAALWSLYALAGLLAGASGPDRCRLPRR